MTLAAKMISRAVRLASLFILSFCLLKPVFAAEVQRPGASSPSLRQIAESGSDIPGIVKREGVPSAAFALINLPAFRFERGVIQQGKEKTEVEVVERNGNFIITKNTSDKGATYFSYLGPVSIAKHSARGNKYHRRTLDVDDFETGNSDLSESIDGISAQDLSIAYRWKIVSGSSRKTYQRSIEAIDTTEADVMVNGRSLRLRAFVVISKTKLVGGKWKRERRSIYVPALGAVTEQKKSIEAGSQSAWRYEGFEVSAQDLARLEGLALSN